MFLLKHGVSLRGVTPTCVAAMTVAGTLYWRSFNVVMFVTSVTDGEHSLESKHYRGDAFDLRTRTLGDEQKRDFGIALASELGKDFDVIVENTHIHVEYEPRGKA